ncbi:MAG: peptidoglycan -binding protein [Rhodospirillales bacterium]|jgi:chemotaxis protein MotB|nr:peptidoglycan -binding protein [Rhodospirillales bacterium]MDP6774537.1 peptidoglycan -binding protein [Rhodospirillales bacterium]
MAAIARSQRSTNIWPGFVDALATLLLVLVFLIMVFVLAQFFLSEAISGRDSALQKLDNQVSELAELLALERRTNSDLRLNVTQLSRELQASVASNDDLQASVQALMLRAEGAETEVVGLKAELADAFETIAADKTKIEAHIAEIADAFKTIEADKAKIETQVAELVRLNQQVAALRALRDDLQEEVAAMSGKLKESGSALVEERKISESARAQLALLNRQMAALREQLSRLTASLEAAEAKDKKQKVEIASLGKRLNVALAGKVQELSRYRSEFFGRLREVLGNNPGVRVVGDRFVFQSEVLYETGSDEIGASGKKQLARLAETLHRISPKIPKDIKWILRVDGHTDKVPISTAKLPSNWELSTARAISVVKFLMSQGIPAERLAATGFGEHQPLDTRDDEIAFRRNRRIELKLTQR